MKMNLFVFFSVMMAIAYTMVGCELVDPEFTEEASPEVVDSQLGENTTMSETAPATSGGSEEFLWKPESESNGKLVVLLPSSLRGQVSSCTISGSFGSENGSFAGDTHNGNRPHYRFSNHGSQYGTDITVSAKLHDGATRTWSIPNGANRTTY